MAAATFCDTDFSKATLVFLLSEHENATMSALKVNEDVNSSKIITYINSQLPL